MIRTVQQNLREMELLKELIELKKLRVCSAHSADAASAIITADIDQFQYMDVSEAVDLALELVRVR